MSELIEIDELPEAESIADADLFVVYVVGAGTNKTRRMTFETLRQLFLEQEGDGELNELSVTTLEAGDADVVNLGIQNDMIWADGATISKILRAAPALSPSNINAGSSEVVTASVPGAEAGDHVVMNIIEELPAGLLWTARVSAADTVAVKFHNTIGSTINGATYNARILVIKAS